MKVFAIIVIYNGMRNNWIQKCFDSVINSSIPVQIIAIDNGSNDGSVAFIQKNYPQIEFIISKENLGFGKANNIGFEKALELGGKYFFLLNQDARVDTDTIEKLVLQSEKNPQYAVISPIHLNGKGDALDYNFSHYITPNFCKNLYSDFVVQKLKDTVYESDFICAAAWLVTKESLRVIGGFSPVFYHYGEDDNYVNRLKFSKLKIGVYPKVSIYHDREERQGGVLKDKEFNRTKSVLLNNSNPLKKQDIAKKIQTLSFKIIVRKIFSRGTILEDMQLEKKVLIKFKDQIEENNKISLSNDEYKFLNIKH
ncbi:glycosyltransferase family 2 protein [Epilithonimonas sp. UC225_85]|uniref:glycosyltransferase family 2 protein n=1 Tax=Epilithonimonas sp. UC225_85 TaxID=3350167 RepID=UPI0036D27A7B